MGSLKSLLGRNQAGSLMDNWGHYSGFRPRDGKSCEGLGLLHVPAISSSPYPFAEWASVLDDLLRLYGCNSLESVKYSQDHWSLGPFKRYSLYEPGELFCQITHNLYPNANTQSTG